MAACSQFSENNLDEQKDPHYLAGKDKAERHEYQGAIESFEKALESNPRSASAHFELGVLYESHINDYLAAGYHYERFLHLRPDSDFAEVVRQHITACKVELAKTVSFGVPTQEVQRNFEKLMNENNALKGQVEALKIQLAQRPIPMTNAPAPVMATNPVARAVITPPPTPVRKTNEIHATPPPPKTHTVKAGENPASIARQYGLSVTSLMEANPGLVAKKLRVGQVVNIPSKR